MEKDSTKGFIVGELGQVSDAVSLVIIVWSPSFGGECGVLRTPLDGAGCYPYIQEG